MARNAILPAPSEALRVESFRVVEKARVALKGVRVDGNQTAFRNEIPADRDILDRFSGDTRSGRIQAHRFPNDHFGVRETRQIGRCWWAAVQHLMELAEQSSLDLGVLCQEVPRPCQGRGR